MDLPPLDYSRPPSLAEAFAMLERAGSRVYAGGTDLIVALQERTAWVDPVQALVDIKDLDEAKGIADLGEELRIGALVTAEALASSKLVRDDANAVAEAAAATSAPMLRARGTVGGNLVTPHPAGDVATALLALDASVEIATSATTVETVDLASLLVGQRTAVGNREILLAVRVPKCESSAFEKQGARRAFSRSTVAIALARAGHDTSVSLAGLAARPFLGKLTAQAIDQAIAIGPALRADCAPHGRPSNADLESLCAALLERALLRLEDAQE